MNILGSEVLTSSLQLGFSWALLLPVLIVLGGAVIGLLFEAFVPHQSRWSLQTVWSALVIIVALLTFAPLLGGFDLQTGYSLVAGELTVDGFAIMAQLVMLVIGLLAILPMIDRTELLASAFAGQPSDTPGSFQEEQTERRGYQRSEMLPLSLFSLGGMMLFPMANSLLTMFVVLEVISLPMYVMTAMARHRRLLSQEAALKYFMLGAFASAFFLMGISLIYGYSGSLQLNDIAMVIPYHIGSTMMLLSGAALILVGLLFKVGAAPFHAWTPDVYQGAPTPVTGFMAAGVKAAAFLTMLRFYSLIIAQAHQQFLPFCWTVAILTMVVGTFFGLVQGNIKRMLAYSSIAHAGYILIAFVPDSMTTNAAVLFYLLGYAIPTIGAFGVIYLVRQSDNQSAPTAEDHRLQAWAGFGKTHPVLGTCMMIFLLSFAGIPLTAGFMGKFLVFSAGVEGGAIPLVIAAVISSALTAFYYFRLGKLMFLDDPYPGTVVAPGAAITEVAVVICAVLTLLLGILPGPVMSVLQQTAIVVP